MPPDLRSGGHNDRILIILKLKYRKKQMKMTDICYENNKNIDAMQMHINKNNLLQIYEFYVLCESFN